MHAVSWELLCKHPELGGLGFRKLSCMNDAFIMKTLWKVLTEPDELWVSVLYGKFETMSSLLWAMANLFAFGRIDGLERKILYWNTR
ncbi:hypothetical protein AHAS_Ahas05G0114600 [Arachis hypogaea]